MIILPELFTTGFTMEAEGVAETMDGEGVQWMLDTANKKNCVVLGSLVDHRIGLLFQQVDCRFSGRRY